MVSTISKESWADTIQNKIWLYLYLLWLNLAMLLLKEHVFCDEPIPIPITLLGATMGSCNRSSHASWWHVAAVNNCEGHVEIQIKAMEKLHCTSLQLYVIRDAKWNWLQHVRISSVTTNVILSHRKKAIHLEPLL